MFLALTKIYQDEKNETEAGNVDREKTAPVQIYDILIHYYISKLKREMSPISNFFSINSIVFVSIPFLLRMQLKPQLKRGAATVDSNHRSSHLFMLVEGKNLPMILGVISAKLIYFSF